MSANKSEILAIITEGVNFEVKTPKREGVRQFRDDYVVFPTPSGYADHPIKKLEDLLSTKADKVLSAYFDELKENVKNYVLSNKTAAEGGFANFNLTIEFLTDLLTPEIDNSNRKENYLILERLIRVARKCKDDLQNAEVFQLSIAKFILYYCANHGIDDLIRAEAVYIHDEVYSKLGGVSDDELQSQIQLLNTLVFDYIGLSFAEKKDQLKEWRRIFQSLKSCNEIFDGKENYWWNLIERWNQQRGFMIGSPVKPKDDDVDLDDIIDSSEGDGDDLDLSDILASPKNPNDSLNLSDLLGTPVGGIPTVNLSAVKSPLRTAYKPVQQNSQQSPFRPNNLFPTIGKKSNVLKKLKELIGEHREHKKPLKELEEIIPDIGFENVVTHQEGLINLEKLLTSLDSYIRDDQNKNLKDLIAKARDVTRYVKFPTEVQACVAMVIANVVIKKFSKDYISEYLKYLAEKMLDYALDERSLVFELTFKLAEARCILRDDKEKIDKYAEIFEVIVNNADSNPTFWADVGRKLLLLIPNKEQRIQLANLLPSKDDFVSDDDLDAIYEAEDKWVQNKSAENTTALLTALDEHRYLSENFIYAKMFVFEIIKANADKEHIEDFLDNVRKSLNHIDDVKDKSEKEALQKNAFEFVKWFAQDAFVAPVTPKFGTELMSHIGKLKEFRDAGGESGEIWGPIIDGFTPFLGSFSGEDKDKYLRTFFESYVKYKEARDNWIKDNSKDNLDDFIYHMGKLDYKSKCGDQFSGAALLSGAISNKEAAFKPIAKHLIEQVNGLGDDLEQEKKEQKRVYKFVSDFAYYFLVDDQDFQEAIWQTQNSLSANFSSSPAIWAPVIDALADHIENENNRKIIRDCVYGEEEKDFASDLSEFSVDSADKFKSIEKLKTATQKFKTLGANTLSDYVGAMFSLLLHDDAKLSDEQKAVVTEVQNHWDEFKKEDTLLARKRVIKEDVTQLVNLMYEWFVELEGKDIAEQLYDAAVSIAEFAKREIIANRKQVGKVRAEFWAPIVESVAKLLPANDQRDGVVAKVTESCPGFDGNVPNDFDDSSSDDNDVDDENAPLLGNTDEEKKAAAIAKVQAEYDKILTDNDFAEGDQFLVAIKMLKNAYDRCRSKNKIDKYEEVIKDMGTILKVRTMLKNVASGGKVDDDLLDEYRSMTERHAKNVDKTWQRVGIFLMTLGVAVILTMISLVFVPAVALGALEAVIGSVGGGLIAGAGGWIFWRNSKNKVSKALDKLEADHEQLRPVAEVAPA